MNKSIMCHAIASIPRMTLGALLASLYTPLVISPAGAQTPIATNVAALIEQVPDITLATRSAEQQNQKTNKVVDDLLRDWQLRFKLTPGLNSFPDGRKIFISEGVAQIALASGSTDWVAAKIAAYNNAELDAKKKIASFVGTYVQAQRSYSALARGTDEALAPIMENANTQLSLVAKMQTLAGAQLDAAIKTFDPNWNGTGVTEAQRQARKIALEQSISTNHATYAQALIHGAMTVAQFEGNDVSGKPSVIVVMQWSNKLQSVAALVRNPSSNTIIDLGPRDISIQEQITNKDRLNPNWLSTANGVRVWVDENAKPVVLGFGIAPATSITSIDKSRARLAAEAAIVQFAAENIVAEAAEKGAFVYQEDNKGRAETFNANVFKERIQAQSASIKLAGVVEIAQWRGVDELGKVPMQVVVIAWSPVSASVAGNLQKEMQNPGPQEIRRDNQTTPAPVGAPAREGVGADPFRF